MSLFTMARARDYVRVRATEMMSASCVITRPKDPHFVPGSGNALAGTRTTVYTGRCRVWEVTNGGVVMVGEDEVSQQNTQISIPWATSPVPIKGDYIKISASTTDTNLVGRVFMITDMAKSGELRATRRFSVLEVQEQVHGRN